MTKNYFMMALLFAAMITLGTSCDDDDPIIPNEEELITTITYTLTPEGGGESVILSFRDLDGDGGEAATIAGGTLAADQAYIGVVDLLNEAESPAEVITEEVKDEDEEHQFFFASSVNDLSVAYSDEDSEGNPVGLTTALTTGGAGSGSLTITLVHEPEKDADGVQNGNLANASGEIDIEVTFPIEVQ